MKYFIDTEFIDDGKTIDLISIGIVAEDCRELYLQSCEFDHRKASDWVKKNVFSRLQMCPHTDAIRHDIEGLYRADRAYHKRYGGQCTFEDPSKGIIGGHTDCPWRTREQIRDEVVTFLGTEDFDLYGWCSAYDFVAFCQLFGTMMDLPGFYPHYIRDLQYELDLHGLPDNALPQQEGAAHNALSDARHIKRLWNTVFLGKGVLRGLQKWLGTPRTNKLAHSHHQRPE